ncbi:hypothetical protein [Eikenella sp. Marseille-P7795]|uniref:hypothetical protein n=1 Tax=Eikenella sp. Marseille-P7795 TaxID=2866577 RepID=UPI001CE3CF90|nr:hypothetical protein [Eikenella sp. Marseille-P7795]
MQQNNQSPKFKVILPEGFSLERPKQVITQPADSGRADIEEIIRQERVCREAEAEVDELMLNMLRGAGRGLK